MDVQDANMKSPNMEKLGCKKGLDKLQKNMKVRGFVTDDHSQISAMMSKNFLFSIFVYIFIYILYRYTIYIWGFVFIKLLPEHFWLQGIVCLMTCLLNYCQ